MKEDFELQQVSLRTSRKDSLCLSAFVAKIGHEGTKTQRKLFRKGYLVFYSGRRSSKKQLFMCCTEFDGLAGPEVLLYNYRKGQGHEWHKLSRTIIRVIRGLIVTKKEKFPNKDLHLLYWITRISTFFAFHFWALNYLLFIIIALSLSGCAAFPLNRFKTSPVTSCASRAWVK